MVRVDFIECQAQPDIDATTPQYAHRASAQFFADFRHHLLGEIEQQEFHLGRIKAHMLCGGVGQRAKLQDQFRTGVGRPHHYDRAPHPCKPGVGLQAG